MSASRVYCRMHRNHARWHSNKAHSFIKSDSLRCASGYSVRGIFFCSSGASSSKYHRYDPGIRTAAFEVQKPASFSAQQLVDFFPLALFIRRVHAVNHSFRDAFGCRSPFWAGDEVGVVVEHPFTASTAMFVPAAVIAALTSSLDLARSARPAERHMSALTRRSAMPARHRLGQLRFCSEITTSSG
jgi:hypothetical protein